MVTGICAVVKQTRQFESCNHPETQEVKLNNSLVRSLTYMDTRNGLLLGKVGST